jgi:hypothetical protein
MLVILERSEGSQGGGDNALFTFLQVSRYLDKTLLPSLAPSPSLQLKAHRSLLPLSPSLASFPFVQLKAHRSLLPLHPLPLRLPFSH